MELERVLAPLEMIRAADQMEMDGRADLAHGLRESDSVAFLGGQSRLEPYKRVDLGPGATFYSTGAPPDRRSLLVAFCGRAHRLMLPLSVFLQHLPARDWDALVLRDEHAVQYSRGARGFADTFAALVDRISAIAVEYRRCVTFGTSMGGLPAIRFALMARSERGISVGGRPPTDVLKLRRNGVPRSAFDLLCACLPPDRRNLLFTCSEGCRADEASARLYADLTRGLAWPVTGEADHNLLHGLLLKGALGDFLHAVLNRPLEELRAAPFEPYGSGRMLIATTL
jgi:hypothetical protein